LAGERRGRWYELSGLLAERDLAHVERIGIGVVLYDLHSRYLHASSQDEKGAANLIEMVVANLQRGIFEGVPADSRLG
jgi:hypothetical protein